MLSKILELYGNESILNKEIEERIIKFWKNWQINCHSVGR